ncbi:TetR/AcrR family transcriptional regulator [Zhongshania sp.]|uniref:TetR/AcrR family transcriptional regulator n=1 Tax=Zhongshania sp. TaxID=1971902 RepID=UPI00356813FA
MGQEIKLGSIRAEASSRTAKGKKNTAVKDPKAVQARAVITQNRLLAGARTLFARSGFNQTGISDLLLETATTRGALYHHFAGKTELFEAVFRLVAADLHDIGAKAAAPFSGDPWKQLLVAIDAHLKMVTSNEECQRILLIDGPAVLGWQRWREILSEYLLDGFVVTFEMLMARKIIAEQPAGPLATLVMGALHDASLAIAHAEDHVEAQVQFKAALISLIEGLRV